MFARVFGPTSARTEEGIEPQTEKLYALERSAKRNHSLSNVRVEGFEPPAKIGYC